MGTTSQRPPRDDARQLWDLARRQHGVVTRAQLLDLGLHRGAVAHRLRSGRLHPVQRGVYAVGRPDLSQRGRWMAAVSSCGETAVLSHRSAAALHGIADPPAGPIEVTVAPTTVRSRPGLITYRRLVDPDERTQADGVPVTTVERTLLDIAPMLSSKNLEAAINTADKHDLVDPERLRSALERYAGRRGVRALRQLLDRHTFVLTASQLEREFLPIARSAGLGQPKTGAWLNGFEVDFFWPDLGLVVETDGLRYHRTPAAQARDRLRDQAHAAAGLSTLRFTHAQVRYEPDHVRETLAAVALRLGSTPRVRAR
ncbi:MAG TPA: type IV toxin-antitoxin system AbiEi family antitoxin domain-containing protein [Thermoleophilaceae bacterium]|nr:type IV toxin-antitoxin system AbiEi family antitoxin domain-containing protein [Thermoleophilaceae bacterium]